MNGVERIAADMMAIHLPPSAVSPHLPPSVSPHGPTPNLHIASHHPPLSPHFNPAAAHLTPAAQVSPPVRSIPGGRNQGWQAMPPNLPLAGPPPNIPTAIVPPGVPPHNRPINRDNNIMLTRPNQQQGNWNNLPPTNQSRGPPMNMNDQSRGPPMNMNDQSRGPLMNMNDQSRGPPMNMNGPYHDRNAGPPYENTPYNRPPGGSGRIISGCTDDGGGGRGWKPEPPAGGMYKMS